MDTESAFCHVRPESEGCSWQSNFKKNSFIDLFYLFLVVLGLHCFTDFSLVTEGRGSSCHVQASHCTGFSCCRAGLQQAQASVVAAHGSVVVAPGLQSTDPVVAGLGLSFSVLWDLPRPGIEPVCVSCIGRPILHHWATGEAPVSQ